MRKLGEHVGDFLAHFAAIDDHVNGAMIEQKLTSLESFW
jgi:hypothetical protein